MLNQLDALIHAPSPLPMPAEHRANITWSQALADRGLPDAGDLTAPAWIDPDSPEEAEGHDLVCRFATSPREQGNPSAATVHFSADDGPHDRLVTGAVLRLQEPDTGQYASVSILA